MKKVQIYASVKAAKELLFSERWLKIINEFCDINIDVTEEELNDLECQGEPDENPFFQLMNSSDSAIASKSEIEEIKKDYSRVLESPSAIFLLDISVEDAATIEKEYGVICKSDREPLKEDILSGSREIVSIEGSLKHNWKEFLSDIKHEPTNTVIINDRYVFAHDDKQNTPGIDSVMGVLDAILPTTFSANVPYHVLIVYSEANNNKEGGKVTCKMSFDKLLTALNKRKKELGRDYGINIELWSIPCNSYGYEKTHNRRVITNYHLIRCEHTLNAFNNGKATTSQTINYDAFFSRGINDASDAPYISTDLLLSDLSDINVYGQGHTETCMYKRGINGMPSKSQEGNKKIVFSKIENRLIAEYVK